MLTENYEIKVDIFEAYRYLGCHGEMDESIKSELLDAAELICKASRPRVVKIICDVDRSDGLALTGTPLRLEGRAISALLHGCESCAIFCATIGGEVESLTRRWEIKNIGFAAMLDACASSAVETLCNAVEDELSHEYAELGLHLTDRFSPGYADFPIAIQKDFCAVLDTHRKIGISVSESGIMIPRKSVTAIIGIAHEEQKHRVTGCAYCRFLSDCKFRKEGMTCYGQAV